MSRELNRQGSPALSATGKGSRGWVNKEVGRTVEACRSGESITESGRILSRGPRERFGDRA